MKGTVLGLTGCMLLTCAVAVIAQDTARVDTTARPTNSRLQGARPDYIASNIRAYARSTKDSFATYTGQVDDQKLLSCYTGRCRYGPRAIIQPRLGMTDSASTTRDSGGVIARIINLSDAGYIARIVGRDTVYKFNMHARDTVYWWAGVIDGKPASVFVSSKRGVRPMRSDLEVEPHERGTWKQPLARWLWTDKDEETWASCDGSACCKSRGIAL